MSRLLWLVAGFIGGSAAAQNARQLPTPTLAAVALVFVVGCGLTWFAAYRGKSVAVAMAVANATAEANARADSLAVAAAEAEAKAAALAQVVVNVGGVPAPSAQRVPGVDRASEDLAAALPAPWVVDPSVAPSWAVSLEGDS